jgi:hypothetical protein
MARRRTRQNPTTAQWWLIGGAGAVVVGVGAYFLFRSPPAAAATVSTPAPGPQFTVNDLGPPPAQLPPAPQLPAASDTLLTPQQAANATWAAIEAASAAANANVAAAPIHVSSTPLGHGMNPTATVRVGDRFQVDDPYPPSAGAAWEFSADATYLNAFGGGLFVATKVGQVTVFANLMQPDGSSLDGKAVIVTVTP